MMRSRRRVLPLAGALITALVLAGCTTSGSAGTTSPPDGATTSVAPAPTSTTTAPTSTTSSSLPSTTTTTTATTTSTTTTLLAEGIEVRLGQEGAGGRRIDVFIPEDGQGPLAVLFPGGGWLSADRSSLWPLAARLADAGIVAVVADYRTVRDGVGFPGQLDDVVCALDHARRRASSWGADPSTTVAMGYSAGAHLTALASLVGDRYGEPCGATDPLPTGFVGAAGPYDIKALAGYLALIGFLPPDPQSDPEPWRAADPFEHAGERPELPVALVHGREDPLVPFEMSVRFGEALAAAGHPTTVDLLAGTDHPGVLTSAELLDRLLELAGVARP